MKKILAILGAVIFAGCAAEGAAAPGPAGSADEIKTVAWNQLTDDDLGKTRIVCGPVAAAKGPGELHGPGLTPTLGSLVLGGEPTEDLITLSKETYRFKIVIPIYDETFPKNPSQYFKGKEVCVAASIVYALVGGYEVLPTHGSQIAVRGEGHPVIPRGRVKSLPTGAVSYEDAQQHMGQTKTVCGVVQSVWQDMVPAKMFPPGFTIPKFVLDRLSPGFALSTEQRLSHELYLGDRVHFVVTLVDDAIKDVTRTPYDYYRGKDVCVTGLLKPSIFEGVTVSVERGENIKIIG